MKAFDDITYIEQFLAGNLSKEENQAFEDAIANNSELKEEVLLHQDLLSGLQVAGDRQLANNIELAESKLVEQGFFDDFENDLDKELLDGITFMGDRALKEQIKAVEQKITKEGFFPEQTSPIPSKSQSKPLRIILAVAATILVLILASRYLLPSHSHEAIYTQYFEIDPSLLQQKITDLNVLGLADQEKERKTSLKKALENYQACTDPACKEQSLTNQLNLYPTDGTALFYTALSNMEAAKFDLAASILKELADQAQSEWSQTASWYLALAYSQMPDATEKARLIFEQIARDQHSIHHEQALNILKNFYLD